MCSGPPVSDSQPALYLLLLPIHRRNFPLHIKISAAHFFSFYAFSMLWLRAESQLHLNNNFSHYRIFHFYYPLSSPVNEFSLSSFIMVFLVFWCICILYKTPLSLPPHSIPCSFRRAFLTPISSSHHHAFHPPSWPNSKITVCSTQIISPTLFVPITGHISSS